MRDAALPLEEEVVAPPVVEVAAPPVATIVPPPLPPPIALALPKVSPVERRATWYAWISDAPSWLVSLTLHLVVLLGLGVATYQGLQGVDVLELVLHDATPAEDSGSELSTVTFEAIDATATLEESLGDDTGSDDSDLAAPDLASTATALVGDLAAAEYAHPRAFERRQKNRSSSSGMKGDANGMRAEFFGIEASGRRFVFIIDCSQSMAGQRYKQAKSELYYALRRLDSSQEFYVFFFAGAEVPMFNYSPRAGMSREPMLATPDNIAKFVEWADRLPTMSGTDPSGATARAIAMEPDAIFLLSDGDFNNPVLMQKVIASKNFAADPTGQSQVRVPIHTIGFHNDDQKQLSAIAKQCGGTYQFVPRGMK